MPNRPIDLTQLLTEQRNRRSMAIDEMPVPEILALMNEEDALVPQAIATQLAAITALVETAVSSMRGGGRLIYAGAGTSGRLGVLDASECPPTFGTDPALVVALMAGGDQALRDSFEDAEDDPALARRDLMAINLGPDDILIGIAASGRTPYTVAAVQYANEIGAASGCIEYTRFSARGNGRAAGRHPHRPGSDHRLHAPQSGQRPENGAQYDQHRGHDPPRQSVQQPHGRRAAR